MSASPPGMSVGLAHEVDVEVTPSMVPGHVAAAVISTPSLVSVIEGACRRLVLPFIEQGHETVGIHICVSHEGVALVGDTVRITACLAAIDGRKLTFDVDVTGPRGRVSTGTHRRAIIDPRRFG